MIQWADVAAICWVALCLCVWWFVDTNNEERVTCEGCGRRCRPSEVGFGGRDEVLCDRCGRGDVA